MVGSRSLPDAALHYGIYSAQELAGLALPEIHFCDAESLPFPSGHFDVIVSQVAVPYVARKDRLLAETWRALKPGGTAFLHMDSTRGDETGLIGGDSPCLVIYRDALDLQRELGEPVEIANALYNCSLALSFFEERRSEAPPVMDEAAAIYEELGDENGLGNIEWARGTHAIYSRDFHTAIEHLMQSAAHYEKVGNEFGRGYTLCDDCGVLADLPTGLTLN